MKQAKFYILDKNFETLAHIDHFKSILWTDKYDEPGSFEMIVSPTETMLQCCVMDNYLWSSNSDTLMIIEKIEYKSSYEDGLEMVVSGRDLRAILERRILLIKAKFNGNLEDSVRQIVNYCIMDPYVLQAEGDSWTTAEFKEKVYLNEDINNKIREISFYDGLRILSVSVGWGSSYVAVANITYIDENGEEVTEESTSETLKNRINEIGPGKMRIMSSPVILSYYHPYIHESMYYTELKYRLYDADRKIANFRFEYSHDERVNTPTIDNEFGQGTNLLNVVQTLCKAKNLGFKITIDENRYFVLKLYSGDDRSYNQDVNPWIIFSPQHNNLISSSFKNDKGEDYANFVYYTDGDKHADEVSTGETGLYRKEHYESTGMSMDDEDKADATSQSKYMARFAQKGKDVLKEKAVAITTDSEVETRFHTEYGVDYFIGDIVQLQNEFGLEHRLRVTEFVTSYDTGGFEMHPTLTEIIDV